MNSALTSLLQKPLSLQPAAPVQALQLSAGQSLWVHAQSGIVWLTCEGQPKDYFVQAGESLRFDGPTRLYLGAQGSQTATLRLSSSCTVPAAIERHSAASQKSPAVPGLHTIAEI